MKFWREALFPAGYVTLFMARLAILLVWYFSDYLGTAYQTVIWPCLGFLFMPLTTLAYAWAWHRGNSSVAGIGLAVVVIAGLIDLGLLGTSELQWSWWRIGRRQPANGNGRE